jgi:hypothetical protein
MKNYISLLLLSLLIAGCGDNDNEKLNSLANTATKCDEVSLSNTNYSWYLDGKEVAKAARLIKLNNKITGESKSFPTNCGEAKSFAINNSGSMEFGTLTPIGFPKMEEEYGGCWCKGFNDGMSQTSF